MIAPVTSATWIVLCDDGLDDCYSTVVSPATPAPGNLVQEYSQISYKYSSLSECVWIVAQLREHQKYLQKKPFGMEGD